MEGTVKWFNARKGYTLCLQAISMVWPISNRSGIKLIRLLARTILFTEELYSLLCPKVIPAGRQTLSALLMAGIEL